MAGRSSKPPAKCKKCDSLDVKFYLYKTFSYWYCSKCKGEVDVKYSTTMDPKGLIPAWIFRSSNDDYIELTDTGLYRLEYVDGSIDYWSKEFGGVSYFDGELVRSAVRIT